MLEHPYRENSENKKADEYHQIQTVHLVTMFYVCRLLAVSSVHTDAICSIDGHHDNDKKNPEIGVTSALNYFYKIDEHITQQCMLHEKYRP